MEKMSIVRIISFLIYLMPKFGVFALYEDQIGKFDWRLQHIGKVSKLVFDLSSDKRIYAITEQNVLAALNSATGEIVWRHIFEQNEAGRVSELLLSQSGDVVTLSGGGQYLMNWERHRGTLRWSNTISTEHCDASKMAEYKSGHVAVLSPCLGQLSAFDRTGTQVWTISLQKQPGMENFRWHNLVAGGGSNEIIVLGADQQSSSVTVVIISATGSVVKSATKNVVFDENRVAILANPSRLFWLDASGGVVNGMASSDGRDLNPVVIPGMSSPHSLRIHVYSGRHFALMNGAHVWIPIQPSADDHSNIDFKLEKIEGVAAGFATSENVVYAAVASLSARGGFSVRFYDTRSGTAMNDWDILVPATEVLSIPEEIYPFIQQKADKTVNNVGLFVTGTDHSLALINQPGKIIWNRQEALASILSVEMLDLPLSEAQANIEEEFSTNGTLLSMFIRRITTQVVQLQRVLLNAVNEIFGLADLLGKSGENWLAPLTSGRSEKSLAERNAGGKGQRLERDYFNLHKVIVVTTTAGKVFGLDNTRGTVIWQKYLPDIQTFTKLSKPSMPLYVLRTTAHYPFPAQCAIIARLKASGNGVLITFNPITGSEFQSFPLQTGVKQSFILPVVDEHEVQGIGMITDDAKAYIYPATVAEIFSTTVQQKPYVVFLADAKGMLNGQRIVGPPLSKSQNFAVFELDSAWKTALPLDKQGKLIGAVTKRFSEQVHSQGRALGDRSVLYKYVNPNLVAAVAESVDSSGKSQMNVYLFDAVTGDIIFNSIHRRVMGPYHLVHCENWIVYTYWNEKARRNEIAVLELYEGKEQADPVRFSSLKPPQPPIVMRQAYVFPQGITAMAMTDTEKGITSRHLLLAMPFGGILELSKAFLDPRRVLNPTMEQREEGLYPYIPDLPIVTEQIINYNQSVYNIRAIHAAPSGLESTSLVLAYGLDAYFTRVTPSGTFDILKDDFDHWLIGCVLIGLFVSSAITKKLARHRDVKMSWR